MIIHDHQHFVVTFRSNDDYYYGYIGHIFSFKIDVLELGELENTEQTPDDGVAQRDEISDTSR